MSFMSSISKYCNRLTISILVLCMGCVPKVFSCLKLYEIENKYFRWLYMKEFLMTMKFYVIRFDWALLFIMYMRWMISKGLYKTCERSSMLCHNLGLTLTSRLWFWDVKKPYTIHNYEEHKFHILLETQNTTRI